MSAINAGFKAALSASKAGAKASKAGATKAVKSRSVSAKGISKTSKYRGKNLGTHRDGKPILEVGTKSEKAASLTYDSPKRTKVGQVGGYSKKNQFNEGKRDVQLKHVRYNKKKTAKATIPGTLKRGKSTTVSLRPSLLGNHFQGNNKATFWHPQYEAGRNPRDPGFQYSMKTRRYKPINAMNAFYALSVLGDGGAAVQNQSKLKKAYYKRTRNGKIQNVRNWNYGH